MHIIQNGVYILVGANGAGKTTLAKEILKENRSICSMMKQDDNQILQHETVLTNITMNVLSEETVITFLKSHELEYLLAKKSKYLSGGEKRLVNLLRVVLSKQELLILDEPSNDLDTVVFEKVKQIIYQIAQTKKILLITHDDRFTEYEKKLIIKNSKIYDEAEELITCGIHFDKESEAEREIKLKLRKTYFLYVFYFLCTTLFAICLGMLLVSDNEVTKPINKKGTYQLATLYSSNSSLYDNNESINTLLVQSATKYNKSQFFSEEKRINEDEYHEQAIKLKSNTYKNLFFLELYNPESKEFIDVKALMMAKLRADLKLSEDVELILHFKNNKSPSLHVPENIILTDEAVAKMKTLGYDVKYNATLPDNQMEMEFSPTLYSQVLSAIKQDHTLLTEARVELKSGDSFYDFLAANKLYAKKILIKGYEPEILNAEINQYSSSLTLIKKVLLFTGMLLLVLFILLYMYEANYRNSYSTLVFYGYDEKDIMKFRKKTYAIANFKLFSIIILAIDMGILWILARSFLSTSIIGVATIFYIIAYIVIPKAVKYSIRKVTL
ncbi:ATP-binding cassette domain-containing protein [Listeria booriae]|uniref:ATP-binding cassette domain-containing protein n=1 Tax=Listeria booriae TaxID=1552123 RepID=UPI001629E380|nr:ABC transporter ATP-binding protein [Listeria booriae]MBC2173736.1 ATP-binding cassette domain-containing protein [Listeria booriae]